jgi:trehalose 6-phosphate synthase
MNAQRLVVVSNRVPVPSQSGSSSAGGLAVALEAALKQKGGLWFGWSGQTVDDEAQVGDLKHQEVGNVTFATMDLLKRDYDAYYAGFSNRALWPLCHYRLDLIQIDQDDTAGYFRVNEQFARALAPLLRPDDLIWIHDYHLIPLASMLRDQGVANRIGFFLHIPWPSPDVAGALPAFQRLLRSFAAYDLIGFQTPRDTRNFGQCMVDEEIAKAVSQDTYKTHDRSFRVGAFPIGIDTSGFEQIAREADAHPDVARMQENMGERDLIIGVDRLDYTKGIKLRLEAFAYFLRSATDARHKVNLLQITPKSRSEVPEYESMEREIAEQVGQVNGTYGDIDWTPVRYINQAVPHTTLAGLYRMARVGLVTPLRDGMNLVAKEYVAAQAENDPGVLVLSRFAGSAYELECALLVNPYDTEATAAAIAHALRMSLEERKERWSTMMERLRRDSIKEWCSSFLTRFGEIDLPSTGAKDKC